MKRLSSALFASLFAVTAVFAQTATQQHQMTQQQHEQMTAHHDRKFVDTMTKHHQDGIRMAELAVRKAQSADLRSMAQKMIDGQRRDIEQMRSVRPEGPMTPMTEMMQMPGMMPESEMRRDMARLESARGHEFDVAFTEIMPKHHSGAIAMSKHELQVGSVAGLRQIAENIATVQSSERQQLLAMHHDMTDMQTMVSSSTERQRMAKE